MQKAVLGGGLGGLSAAYYLSKLVPAESILLLESSHQTGGWIKSRKLENGAIFEQGPRTIRPRGQPAQNTLQLIEELGIADKILPIKSNHPAAQNRLIYANGTLHRLPSSFTSLFKKQEPFTKPLILFLLNDLRAKARLSEDESIYEFTARRFGSEVADYLISPMICGICAGNAKEISANFLLEKFYVYEQEFGSISRGIFHNFLLRDKGFKKYTNALNERARNEKWSIYSFEGGCETLPKSLEQRVRESGVEISTGTMCKKILFDGAKVLLVLNNNERVMVDGVVSSLPAPSLGVLLEHQHPKLAQMLGAVPLTSVAVVNLHFHGKVLENEAFGFLVPPRENLPILGVIYDSCCFPKNEGETVLTVMMGGHWFEQHFGTFPQQKSLLNVALKQLEDILKIKQKPEHFRVSILRNCIPQYIVGHKMNLYHIEDYIKSHKLPIALCGSSYKGVGVNDVILSARNAVDNLFSKP